MSRASAAILGLRTVLVPTPDLQRGKAWYSQALEREPYFDEPYYVGFSVGGFELGLIPDPEPGRGPGRTGAMPYWGVADAAAALARLETIGAKVIEPLADVGGGIRHAAVEDPFGNLFGILENPEFKTGEVE